MADTFELTLNNPLTEEQWDMITDVDFDHTDRIWFHTKHCKEVEFVKVIRCKDCTKYKHWECPIEQAGYRPKEDGYCIDAERKTE